MWWPFLNMIKIKYLFLWPKSCFHLSWESKDCLFTLIIFWPPDVVDTQGWSAKAIRSLWHDLVCASVVLALGLRQSNTHSITALTLGANNKLSQLDATISICISSLTVMTWQRKIRKFVMIFSSPIKKKVFTVKFVHCMDAIFLGQKIFAGICDALWMETDDFELVHWLTVFKCMKSTVYLQLLVHIMYKLKVSDVRYFLLLLCITFFQNAMTVVSFVVNFFTLLDH